jgi:hypothetical protein
MTELYLDRLEGEIGTEEFMKSTGRNIVKNFGLGYPVLVDLWREQATGRESFTGMSIEPAGQQDVAPFYRESRRTPQILKGLARDLRNTPFAFSPPRLDAALRTMMGAWANYGYMATDAWLYPEITPELGLEQRPMVRRFLSRRGQYNKVRQEWYEFLSEAKEVGKTFNRAAEGADVEIMFEYMQRPGFGMSQGADRIQRAIRSVQQQIEEVRENPDIPRSEKRKIENRMRRQIDLMMKSGLYALGGKR